MRVKFNSWLRTKVGHAVEEFERPAETRTVGDLVHWLAGRHPGAAELLAAPDALRFVVDRRYVDAAHEIEDSHTVEIYPPVTGG